MRPWWQRHSRKTGLFERLVQQNVIAIPRTSKIERLSENIDIFDFELSGDEMRQIFRITSPKGRLTDFGFAPKWD